MVELAIVGAGVMGTNHARVAARMTGFDLKWICDENRERREALARRHNLRAVASVEEFPPSVEAAIVAIPTEMHHGVSTVLLRRGIHVLVEKPIAASLEEAAEMLAVAEEAERVLMVGHIERFNPAVFELERIVTDLVHVDAARISPFTPRPHVGVVLDLMIHDLDLLRLLTGDEVRTIHAVGRRTRSEREDVASALLEFRNGTTANLSASRVGQNKIRRLELTQRDSFVTVDLIKQDISIHRVDYSEYLSTEGTRYRQHGLVEIPFLEQRGEPLALELADFLEAVATGRPPKVTARDGFEALRLALTVTTLVDMARQVAEVEKVHSP